MTRFTPGIIDYDGAMATHYPKGRALTSHSAEAWRTAILPFVPQAPGLTILDLGSGTGRFSTFLSEAFAARVIGVEPARGMRNLAARGAHPPTVRFVAGMAERIPLRDRCDVVWVSQVLHHVRDQGLCAAELRRVLRAGGCVVIRSTFAESEDGFPTLLRFFPGVHRIFADLPTIEGTIATFVAHGLSLDTRRRVEQQICGSLREFAERTRLRADSSLALLSDQEFAAGMSALDQAAERESDPVPVRERLDLLVFRASLGPAELSPKIANV
jgi:ubiquinone/menaquinone biosynthesis C-methylase UbiE